MASAKGKVVVSAEVPVELRGEMDARGLAEKRSRAQVIERAVRFYLKHAPIVPADDLPAPLPDSPAADPPKPKGRGKK